MPEAPSAPSTVLHIRNTKGPDDSTSDEPEVWSVKREVVARGSTDLGELTMQQVVEAMLTPPEFKAFRWYSSNGRPYTGPHPVIAKRFEARGGRFHPDNAVCPKCAGSGVVASKPCPTCQ